MSLWLLRHTNKLICHYVFSRLTLYHYGYCIGSHREHGEKEDRTSTEKPKGLRSKQRYRQILCHFSSDLMSLWLLRHTNKLLCLFSSDLMSLWLSFNLPQNKLTCYYVFSYPVHQHHTCGASAHDVRSVSTTETRPQ